MLLTFEAGSRKKGAWQEAPFLISGEAFLTLNILVLDDELDLIEILQDDLEELGHNVSCVNDPLKFSEIFNQKKFDVVFCDHRMPKKDGFQVLKELREDLESEIPFFMITGSLDISESDVIDSKGNGVIVKPFSFDDLEEILKRIEV